MQTRGTTEYISQVIRNKLTILFPIVLYNLTGYIIAINYQITCRYFCLIGVYKTSLFQFFQIKKKKHLQVTNRKSNVYSWLCSFKWAIIYQKPFSSFELTRITFWDRDNNSIHPLYLKVQLEFVNCWISFQNMKKNKLNNNISILFQNWFLMSYWPSNYYWHFWL